MFESKGCLKLQTTILLTFLFTCLVFNFKAQAQSVEVVAQKGEGIYRLLSRHGMPANQYMNSFIELNKDLLGRNNTLYAGRKYKLPDKVNAKVVSSGKQTLTFEIFGNDHAEVQIVDNKLKGTVYYLVAGHGGPDPGAVGYYNKKQLCEDEYAYDVTLRLARNLIQHGATVYMIIRDPNDGIRNDSYLKPDKDEVCYPNEKIPINQLRRLQQRTEAVNALYPKYRGRYQRMVAIHVDSRSRGQNIDVFFYHDKSSASGRKAALILQRKFQQKYDHHQPGRGYKGTVSDRNLYVVRNSFPVAVYIELGNINHTRDQQRFIIPSNRQALANWLYEGLLEDYLSSK
ncbi:MAG TPA: N-acetylmuramoyl-L-alanine amidase [Mariniphaga sp.]|nr:N-acetylmuramoyl-L-alanine amidase [Mariniphaga sp.]